MIYGKINAIEEISKQPYETFLIGFDLSHTLPEGEYLLVDSCDIIAEDSNGDDASADIIDNTDKSVDTASSDEITTTPVTNALLKTRVKSGTSGEKYKITFKAVTSNGNKYEKDIYLSVKNK